MQGLPIGIDDFAKVREGEYYFVDKSLAIRDFLDNHGEVLLLTRPRRFGKTLFLHVRLLCKEQGKQRALFRDTASVSRRAVHTQSRGSALSSS